VVTIASSASEPPTPDQLQWLGRLYAAHRDRILSYCIQRSQSQAQAEDACQEVFVRALKSLPALRVHDNPLGWLYMTARYVTSEEWRSQRRQTRLFALLAFVEGRRAREQDHEYAHFKEIRLMRLDNAIAGLPPSQQMVLQWSLDGMPYKEIARRMEITENAVGTRLHRIRRALKTAFDRMNVERCR
jgi:RNA polymerase sigma factor (sigma-70 family)